RQARFAHEVVAAVGRGHYRRYRGDENNRGRKRRIRTTARDLVARNRLRQEIRTLQVRPQQLLEALFGGVEQIRAHARRAARVVDERVDYAVAVAHGVDDPRAVGGLRDVAAEIAHIGAVRAELLDRRLHVGVRTD